MANHASAKKAARQSIKRQKRNQLITSRCKTSVKGFRAVLSSKKDGLDKEKLMGLFNKIQSELMMAASKGVMKKNTVSRRISRLATALQSTISK